MNSTTLPNIEDATMPVHFFQMPDGQVILTTWVTSKRMSSAQEKVFSQAGANVTRAFSDGVLAKYRVVGYFNCR